FMPRGMKVQDIDSLAARIEGPQLGRMPIGGITLRQNLGASERGTPSGDRIRCPSAAFAPQRFLQRYVFGIQLAVDVRRRLIRKRCSHAVGHARDFTLVIVQADSDYAGFLLPGRNTLQKASCVSM